VGPGLNGSGGSFVGPGFNNAFPAYSPYSWNGTQLVTSSYIIAYNGNGSTGGSVPLSQNKTFGTNLNLQAVGNLTKTSHSFIEWNTASDGSGAGYAAGAALTSDLTATAGTTVTLYAIWGENVINLADPWASIGTGWSYAETGDFTNVFYILNGADIRVTGATTMNRIEVDGAATLTLDGASISVGGPGTYPQNAIDLNGASANLTLRLAAASVLSGGGTGKAGIHVPPGRTLKITSASGDGNYPTSFSALLGNGLSVTGGEGGAGIGGNSGEAAGTITIAGGGGVITAGSGARSIGPGAGGSGGTFNSLNNTWPTNSTFTWPTFDSIDLSCPVLLGATHVTYGGGVYNVFGGANITVVGSTTTDRIQVSGTATITLHDASIELDSTVPDPITDPGAVGYPNHVSPSPLRLLAGANLTLKLQGGNSLYSYSGGNGAGIRAPAGTTLKITEASGDGGHSAWLSVHGAPQDEVGDGRGAGAAIGGSYYRESGGNITISGGQVYAIGGKGGHLSISGGSSGGIPHTDVDYTLGAAGIGGSILGEGGNITLNGGMVHATGWDGGAGIGGGSGAKGGTININNPGVGRGWGHATYSFKYGFAGTSKAFGDGIGDGKDSGGGSSVTINYNLEKELDGHLWSWWENTNSTHPAWY
jgi:hypothetical protein